MNWHAGISAKRLLIAAASARPYVRAAAAAGYQVIAADIFGDEDTRRNAFEVLQLAYGQHGFDANDVRRQLLPRLRNGDIGFVFGSGFEHAPELIDEIAAVAPVWGNASGVVRAVKSPSSFFNALARLRIPAPSWSAHPVDGWLCKAEGGSGGTHVSAHSIGGAGYFQQPLPGSPFAMLFLADGRDAVEIGIHAQKLAPTVATPFRYGGAVSRAILPDGVKAGMFQAAQSLTREFGLRGLNSLDCMVDGEAWWVLEINPRLSAGFGLYDAASEGARLFEAHLRACEGVLDWQERPESARAHLIYYAHEDLIIPTGLAWPDWVADIPPAGTTVRYGDPLCSILAAAGTAEEAALEADSCARRLKTLLS